MGPTIILDKSAYQCLSREDTFELDRYFLVVVPPVLILEVLADLKKPGMEPDKAQATVRQLARKIQPSQGIINVDYRTLCTNDLLGSELTMDRRPVVGGAKRVVAGDGSVGAFIDVQPEDEALIRWSCDSFDEAEELLAASWRRSSKALDLEAFKRRLQRRIDWAPRRSLSLVRQVVDALLVEPEAQLTLIDCLIEEINAIPEVREWTLSRWRYGGFSRLSDFAAFAHHCARVNLLFQLALVYEHIGTRSTNRIDMEYFYYSPFAHIFCSGDRLHKTLAEEVLARDQSFVWHDDLRCALRQVSEARQLAKESGREDPHGVQPEEGSLIRKLWTRHLGAWPDRSSSGGSPVSNEEQERIMKEIAPFMDACKRAERASPPRPRWPCL
ncbi:MAG: hypothetical protein GY842_27620 [bacterium]|nr:hypothetical protein [bacterium]